MLCGKPCEQEVVWGDPAREIRGSCGAAVE